MSLQITKYKIYVIIFGLAFAGGLFGSGKFLSLASAEWEYAQRDLLTNKLVNTLEEDIVNFHIEMNEITNGFLEKLSSGFTPDVSYVLNPEDCYKNNVSTFCLAVALNEEFTEFEVGLNEREGEFKDSDDEERKSFEEAVEENAYRITLIQNELKSAEEAMELTLATYNEIQIVYPLHKEFQSLFKNLEDFRDGLADIRNVIEYYPGKFNDATTKDCK